MNPSHEESHFLFFIDTVPALYQEWRHSDIWIVLGNILPLEIPSRSLPVENDLSLAALVAMTAK